MLQTIETLTERELEVLAKAAAGLTNESIGGELGIQADTAKKHLHSVYRKLGVKGRVGAVAVYVRWELEKHSA